MRHIALNLAASIEDLFRRVVVRREVRLSELLIFCRTDVIFEMGRLLLIRARIDSVQVDPRESRPSVYVLNAESLLRCAVEQKQGIV